jgi:hypothetical protein
MRVLDAAVMVMDFFLGSISVQVWDGRRFAPCFADLYPLFSSFAEATGFACGDREMFFYD